MASYLDKAGLRRLWSRIKAYIDSKHTPLQTSGYWKYKIHGDYFEAWYYKTGDTWDIIHASGNMFRSDPKTYPFPSALSTAQAINVHAQIFHNNYPTFGAISAIQVGGIKVQVLSGALRASNSNYTTVIYVMGTINDDKTGVLS